MTSHLRNAKFKTPFLTYRVGRVQDDGLLLFWEKRDTASYTANGSVNWFSFPKKQFTAVS